MSAQCYKLFVYGSLRKGFQSPAYDYISRYFNFISSAKVKGILYDMGSYPAALPTNEEKFIIGELYELKNPAEFDWAIAQLDDYEGVHTEGDELPLYVRDIVNVTAGIETADAWIYWYNGDIQNKPIISSGDILDYLKEK
jgi:gamma-glutamylcyclotransferase (GGCT)/AIG2-like uncharacterized protein YtfP